MMRLAGRQQQDCSNFTHTLLVTFFNACIHQEMIEVSSFGVDGRLTDDRQAGRLIGWLMAGWLMAGRLADGKQAGR